jgi:hypothetical protein
MVTKVAEVKSKKAQQLSDRATKGLSLMKLMKSTPPYVKMKSRDEVVVKKFDPQARTKGGYPAITSACVSMVNRAPKLHKQTIIGMDKTGGKVSSQKRVNVSCSCEDFCFTWEYALWTWGAAKIKYCNGEPAVVKNPGNYPGMCKHLTKVAKLVLERKD